MKINGIYWKLINDDVLYCYSDPERYQLNPQSETLFIWGNIGLVYVNLKKVVGVELYKTQT